MSIAKSQRHLPTATGTATRPRMADGYQDSVHLLDGEKMAEWTGENDAK